MATQRIQLRRGTAADWTAVNPVLAEGEPGYERDTGFLKVGNGSDPWTTLEYLTTGSSSGPGPGGGGGGGNADTLAGVTPTDVGLSVLGASDAAAGRNALGVTWTNLSGKPATIAAGTDAAAARAAVGAVDSTYVGQQLSNYDADLQDRGYVTTADLRPALPFHPLTANYLVPQSSTTPTATGLKRTGLEAGKSYRFRIEVDYDMPSSADMKLKFAGPTGSTIRLLAQGPLTASSNAGAWYGVDISSYASVANFGGFSTTSTAVAPDPPNGATATALGGALTRAVVEGIVTLGTTAGTLEVLAGQVTAQPLMGAVLPTSVFDIVECAPAAA